MGEGGGGQAGSQGHASALVFLLVLIGDRWLPAWLATPAGVERVGRGATGE